MAGNDEISRKRQADKEVLLPTGSQMVSSNKLNFVDVFL